MEINVGYIFLKRFQVSNNYGSLIAITRDHKVKKVIFTRYNARLHVVIVKGYKVISKLMILNWKLAYPLSIKNKHLK